MHRKIWTLGWETSKEDFVLGQVSFIHSFIHPWWGKPISIITIDGKTSKEGFSSPWIGNFQRTSLCRRMKGKAGRKEMMKVLGQLSFIHSLIHPWWGKPLFIIFFISWAPSSLSMLPPLLLPLLRLLFLQLQKITISSPSFFSLGGGDIFFLFE